MKNFVLEKVNKLLKKSGFKYSKINPDYVDKDQELNTYKYEVPITLADCISRDMVDSVMLCRKVERFVEHSKTWFKPSTGILLSLKYSYSTETDSGYKMFVNITFPNNG